MTTAPVSQASVTNTQHLQQRPTAPQRAALTPQNVSAAALKAANGDGDGRTGAAALNDGDAASQAARRGAVNIRA
jgi:hypothetical protein